MANRTKFTPEKRAKFLDALAGGSTISAACRLVGMSRRGVYDHKANVEFAAAWAEAEQAALERMEQEADRRAVEGTLKPVFYQGEKCGSIREFSDTLLIFRLKALAPEKYRERVDSVLKGPDGGPIPISVIERRIVDPKATD